MQRQLAVGVSLTLFAMAITLTSCGVSPGSGTGITPPVRLSITSLPLPDGVLQSPYNGGAYIITASGGKAPYVWSWAPGARTLLPPGLTLSSNPDGTGAISGVPSATGTYDVALKVVDSESPPVQTTVTYTLSVLASGSLAIISGVPPSGTVGKPYGGSHIISFHSFTGFPLSATGGLPSYTWSWIAAAGSSLPPGLKIAVLSWGGSTRCCLVVPVINGTPAAAGTYDVVVTIKDSAAPANAVNESYTIVVGS
jgi:hypothetical protein